METNSEMRAAPAGAVHETAPIRVTYRDTDRMGYVYYANYLVWFEVGRTELLRACGDSYRQWEDTHGVYLPVSSCQVQYRQSATYDDEVVVRTRVSRLTKASIEFRYEVARVADSALLATGSTRHALIARDGRIMRMIDRLVPELWVCRDRINQGEEVG